MALSLTLEDALPSTSTQSEAECKDMANISRLSYAEVATGRRVSDFRIESSERKSAIAATLYRTVGDEVSDISGRDLFINNLESDFLKNKDMVLDVGKTEAVSIPFDEFSEFFRWPSTDSDCLQCSSSVTSNQYNEDVWQAAVANMERNNIIREKIGLIINKRYRVMRKISFGSYGSIYNAYDIYTKNNVAIKFEIGRKPPSEIHLNYEIEVYECMKGELGVPTIYWFGKEYDHQILVMQLLGPSLEQLFRYCEHSFDLNTIASLADQMLLRLRSLHSRGFVHRDLKPENFLMGTGDFQNICFLVDFGLARRFRYRDGSKLSHIPFKKGKGLVGTAKYASINSHYGLELSRRDDLESLGYIVIEFINQEVPWKSKSQSRQFSINKIRSIKKQINWKVVCPEMADWITYCQQLRFDEEPDYVYLHGIIQSLLSEKSATEGLSSHSTAGGEGNSLSEAAIEYRSRNHYSMRHVYKYDDGTKRFSWLMKRDSSSRERYTYDCLFG